MLLLFRRLLGHFGCPALLRVQLLVELEDMAGAEGLAWPLAQLLNLLGQLVDLFFQGLNLPLYGRVAGRGSNLRACLAVLSLLAGMD